jgi:hypothetical protein
MIAILEPCSPLDQWRQRFGGSRRLHRQARSLAALGYLTHGPVLDGLVEIDRLTLVVLFDEPLPGGSLALRLAGYAAQCIPWGVRFGGPDQCRFLKNLLLQPVQGARGYRLDLAATDLLGLGLRLDRELDRHARCLPEQVRSRIQLPKLWAAFRPQDAAEITGDGPELAAYAQRTGRPESHLLKRLCREHFGLVLYPLAWVSHHWHRFATIFADLQDFPRRQVFRLHRMPEDLIGFRDAAEFDLFDSRFRRPAHVRNMSASAAMPAE